MVTLKINKILDIFKANGGRVLSIVKKIYFVLIENEVKLENDKHTTHDESINYLVVCSQVFQTESVLKHYRKVSQNTFGCF